MIAPAAFLVNQPSNGVENSFNNSDENLRRRSTLIRGGRVGKHKGIAGGVAPCEAGLVLSFTTLSVAAAFVSLLLWSSPSLAGSCDPSGPGTWSCSGAASGTASDASVAILSPAPVTIVTQPGFGLSTAVEAIRVDTLGGIIITDVNASSIMSSGGQGILAINDLSGAVAITSNGSITGADGIYVSNTGTGSTTVTSSGTVTGTTGDGINVTNDGSATDLTVNQTGGVISGASNGIFTTHYGIGTTTIVVAGDVNGATENGIWAQNFANATDITITQAAGSTITGYTHGIRADNWAAGAVSITTAGIINQTQTGAANNDTYGIYAYNSISGADITLTQTAGSISGNWYAMYANNQGSGSTTIISSGDVTAIERAGLYAYNAGTAQDIVVNQTVGTVKGGTYGVFADNAGIGSTTVSLSGDVIASGDYGVYSRNSSSATDLTVRQTAGSIAGKTGILAWNRGAGVSLVSVGGTVSGGAGAGIQTIAANGSTVDIASSATVTATSGIAIRDGGVGGNPIASDTIGAMSQLTALAP
ncbi:hypothetical protein G6K87_25150 (plasmid) [Agrobacterium tumefaciens]|uniref:beta strand repeat-containing protein n=1 Tax=Agrobacterium tumefaciens TaxID=358 RepID=UPI001F1DBA19|nr:hypothetical protein [Agrobacterium tumefaciens]